jgi:enoyl-CoA hydratase
MNYECFRIKIEDYIATVVFDRPPVNAQNRKSRDELTHIFDSLSDNDNVRVVVLTGAGKTFSAGADVKERVGMAKEDGEYIRHNRVTREFFYAVTDCAKPVITAVNGAAIGAGFCLMMCGDIVLASDNTVVAMTEVDVGLSGGMKFLTQHFGRSYARYIYYTARRIPASELYRLGVIQACVPQEKLMDTAMEIAREIASKSPIAVQTGKRGFNTVEEMPDRDAYRFEQGLTIALSKTEYTKEAQRAFTEKRKPVFKGR